MFRFLMLQPRQNPAQLSAPEVIKFLFVSCASKSFSLSQKDIKWRFFFLVLLLFSFFVDGSITLCLTDMPRFPCSKICKKAVSESTEG
ncbi:hypothetical protein LY78DRAFT_448583 [Colletotrichum sublineola]|nr:hypothetical protein LY78DRAFT_448583 [Colletotrichum sublineola]